MLTDSQENWIGLAFTIITIAIYGIVYYGQYIKLSPRTKRIQILNLRCAMSLPIYTILMFICLVIPRVYNAIQVPIAVVEGMVFTTFFALLTTNLGGVHTTITYLDELERGVICCSCACSSSKVGFYNQVKFAQWMLLYIRPLIVLAATILQENQRIYVLLNIIAFLFVVNAFLSLVLFFEYVYLSTENLKGITKFFILKSSVGLLVVEGLITQIVVAVNAETNFPNSSFSPADQALRLYCFVYLLQYVFYAPALYYAYSPEIVPSTMIIPNKNASTDDLPSFCSFFCEVLKFWDIFSCSWSNYDKPEDCGSLHYDKSIRSSITGVDL